MLGLSAGPAVISPGSREESAGPLCLGGLFKEDRSALAAAGFMEGCWMAGSAGGSADSC